jgi:hypothetical protein
MRSYPPEVEQALVLSQDKFVWETPAYVQYERGPGWYLVMGVVALFFVAYAVWAGNFLFAFLILLMAIILALTGNDQPKTILVQIGDHGVVWGGKLILFQDMDSFAIVYQPPLSKVLYLEPRSPFSPRLRVELEDEDPIALRLHLKQYLQEDLDLQSEHLSDIVARLLRI